MGRACNTALSGVNDLWQPKRFAVSRTRWKMRLLTTYNQLSEEARAI